jgi:putative component of toxin-antitoxin plasmid stabilization module
MKGLNPNIITNSLDDYADRIRQLGVEKVAAKAGVKPTIVRRFLNDVMASKNSDIKKIKDAVNEMRITHSN